MIGTRLSHYEIVAKLGEGGMGIVYKARDPRLDRFVAIKLLGGAVTADAEYRRRLTQEARAASALNHSGIVTIHDVSTDGGQDCIVMEYVSGTTLEALMAGKRLPLRDALNYGMQAAQALAVAHAAGIIHRDLKPSNIMVTDAGVVKILDFGLAKLPHEGADASLATLGENETVTGRALTGVGKIVGTVAYMSPEQAEGKKVDHRSDIFSLGTVLYEMVTGVRPFQADSSISTLSAVLSQDPKPPTELNKSLPRELERIILRCLRKEPAKRLQAMADLAIELDEIRTESSSQLSGVAAAQPQRRRRAPVIAASAVVAGGALAGAWMLWTKTPSLPPPVAVPLTSFAGDELSPALSPDGKQVAFAWNGEQRRNLDIYVMQVGSTTPLPLTNTAANEDLPAWSPDGTQLAFIRAGRPSDNAVDELPTGGSVFLISALAGPERKLLDFQGSTSQLGWTSDGQYLVMDATVVNVKSEILKISVSSSEVTALLSKPITEGRYSLPAASPDGKSLAFAYAKGQQGLGSGLYVVSLDGSGNPEGAPRLLATRPTRFASLVWTADSRSLIYGEAFSRQLWRQPVNGVAERFLTGVTAVAPSISRAGDRLAYVRDDRSSDLWKSERGGQAIPFASSSFADYDAQLSPDGSKIALASGRTGDIAIWVANADGTNAYRLTQESGKRPGSPRWSLDGRQIAYDTQLDDGHSRIFVIDAEGGRPRQLVNSTVKENDEAFPSWSADGKWIYFRSIASGRNEVWRAPAGGGAAAVQVTTNGGSAPWVSLDGKTLYYSRGSNPRQVFAMPIEGGPERVVLQDVVVWNYFPAPDGLYYMARSTDAQFKFEIRFLDTATGATRLLTSFEARTIYPTLSVSRDGKTIIHSAVPLSAGADLMLLEHFR